MTPTPNPNADPDPDSDPLPNPHPNPHRHQVKYARVDKLKMHQEELTTQILMNGEVRKKNRMDFLNEGSRARQQVHAALLPNPTPTLYSP